MLMQTSPFLKVIVILLFCLFLVQQCLGQFVGIQLLNFFAFSPPQFFNQAYYWQILTYSWFHENILHLLFNLFILAWTGSTLEKSLGFRKFFLFYGWCIFSEVICYTTLYFLFPFFLSRGAPLLGMDGFIYGLLGAYALLFGNETFVFMMLFPMKAKHFVFFIAGFELLVQIYSQVSLVATLAHIFCAITGVFFLVVQAWWSLWMRSRRGSGNGGVLSWFQKGKKQKGHLRIVSDARGWREEEQEPKIWH